MCAIWFLLLLLCSPNSFCLLSQQIDWDNCLVGDIGNDCLVTVDGTDFCIQEYGRKFYSHKYKSSGLQYEVALCIVTGSTVWVNGPYECGLWPDINIFQDSLASFLGPNKHVEADDGYLGEAPLRVKCPSSFTNPVECGQMQHRAQAWQETVNKQFKNWGCLTKNSVTASPSMLIFSVQWLL